jgi:hypothetical protein
MVKAANGPITARARRERGSIDIRWSHVVVAAHALFLVSIWWLMSLSGYEDRLFQWLVAKTVTPAMSQEAKALALMHRTHELVGPNAKVFSERPRESFRGGLLLSADVMLQEGYGWCGAFTLVLARALREAGFDVRLAQMKVGDQWGGHILLEAKVDDRWVALDAAYDHAFRRPDGRLASFADISHHWDEYKVQVPPGYAAEYDYDDVRYANWNKIPVAGPAAKALLSRVFGEEPVHTFSPRVYMLNMYVVAAWVLLLLYLVLVAIPSLTWLIRRLPPRKGGLVPAWAPSHRTISASSH